MQLSAYSQSYLDPAGVFAPKDDFSWTGDFNLFGKGGVPIQQWYQNLGGGLDFEREKELQARDMSFNSYEAAVARQWNEYMSNTAYQRQVDDMRKAGLNPYMALGAGGASTPSVSASSSRSSHSPGTGTGNSFMNFVGNILGKLVGGAFGIATQAMRNEYLEDAAELKFANAYDMQTRRFENQRERDFLKHEFNKSYKNMDMVRATAPRESHVWHYSGDKKKWK